MKRILLLLSVLSLSLSISTRSVAQDRTITGKVTSSEDGSAIPGVNSIVEGTSTGTTTDAADDYSISAGNTATLVFSRF